MRVLPFRGFAQAPSRATERPEPPRWVRGRSARKSGQSPRDAAIGDRDKISRLDFIRLRHGLIVIRPISALAIGNSREGLREMVSGDANVVQAKWPQEAAR